VLYTGHGILLRVAWVDGEEGHIEQAWEPLHYGIADTLVSTMLFVAQCKPRNNDELEASPNFAVRQESTKVPSIPIPRGDL